MQCSLDASEQRVLAKRLFDEIEGPAFIAAIASGTVPWPVMNITGIR
jgi:hypothetical protein